MPTALIVLRKEPVYSPLFAWLLSCNLSSISPLCKTEGKRKATDWGTGQCQCNMWLRDAARVLNVGIGHKVILFQHYHNFEWPLNEADAKQGLTVYRVTLKKHYHLQIHPSMHKLNLNLWKDAMTEKRHFLSPAKWQHLIVANKTALTAWMKETGRNNLS